MLHRIHGECEHHPILQYFGKIPFGIYRLHVSLLTIDYLKEQVLMRVGVDGYITN